MQKWKVGELAAAAGLTVRTLHHYDEIGLLSPSARTTSGYRLYSTDDIAKLHRIVALRQLGLSLEQIGACLARPGYSLEQVIELQLARLREEIAGKQQLVQRLETLAQHARMRDASAEEMLKAIEAMNMFEKYYSPEQMEYLRRRREEVGEERIREVEAEWPKLIAEVKAEMERGTDPLDPRVQELARRWQSLVREFTGGDPGISASLKRFYAEEPEAHRMAGFDPSLSEYVSRAVAAGSGRDGE